MSSEYVVRLIDRNEVIDYRDANDRYQFSVRFTNKQWIVSMPGIKGEGYHPHELTEDESRIILPRIKTYLEGLKYLRWVGPTYPVTFAPISPATAERMWRAAALFRNK